MWAPNPDWLHARQAHNPLYYLSRPVQFLMLYQYLEFFLKKIYYAAVIIEKEIVITWGDILGIEFRASNIRSLHAFYHWLNTQVCIQKYKCAYFLYLRILMNL